MGTLEAFTIAGLNLWFNSNDHRPAHFHAGKSDEWEIRVYFLTCTGAGLDYDIKWGSGPSGAEERVLLGHALANRGALLEEWGRKVCQQP